MTWNEVFGPAQIFWVTMPWWAKAITLILAFGILSKIVRWFFD